MLEELSIKQLHDCVVTEYDCGILFYHGDIDETGFAEILGSSLRLESRRDRALLIIETPGGSANAAYKISRFLQDQYDEFFVYMPEKCYSAGTLLCVGANRLFMGPFSQLDSLDAQLLKPNELGHRKSGLVAKSAFHALSDATFELYEDIALQIIRKSRGLVSFKVASEISAQISSNVMSSVYAQFDPNVLGEDRRDIDVAMQYGLRLAEYSENADRWTIRKLVTGYPSHDFIIDRREALRLFKNIDFPSSSLTMLGEAMKELARGSSGRYVGRLNTDDDAKEVENGEQVPRSEKDQEACGEHDATASGMGCGGDSDRAREAGAGSSSEARSRQRTGRRDARSRGNTDTA
ncbi:SDH family Clp fold serine proteinase [Saliniramus sp.]|uniref:SDH family Clp fold serine proteinase n=1 Tax=Saliniramus sp. TaxID=2986772 RepID=UPI002B730A88|nr:hypothetical protein [Saliniramus sp.]HMB11774.1 hypothetical protein [Saliniramus sp.]